MSEMEQPDDVWNWDSGMAPDCEVEGSVIAPIDTYGLRGKLTPDAPLAKLVWFKAGGHADWLFEPADTDDLKLFLERLDGDLPVMALGLGSNLIVRDGGVPGVVVKLGKPFASIEVGEDHTLTCGAGAHGILVASTARDAGIAGVEFMRGIPGTVGGFVRMNGGAYGRETADVLVEAEVVMRDGARRTLPVANLRYTYRHSDLPAGAVVIGATLLVVGADLAASLWLGDPIYRLPMRYGVLRALPLFLLGVAAAFYGSRVYVASRLAGAIGVGAAIALVILQAFGAFSLLSLGLMTVIIWAAGAVSVRRPSRLIEHLALMSFSMFLTNEVTRIVWFGLLDALGQDALSSGVRWALWSIGFIGAFAAAAVFRYGFDRPVQSWLNPSRVRLAAADRNAPATPRASGAVVAAEHAG